MAVVVAAPVKIATKVTRVPVRTNTGTRTAADRIVTRTKNDLRIRIAIGTST